MSPHRAALTELAQQQRWLRGAELGVDKGILFHMLLARCPALSLTGVDIFPLESRRQKCEQIATSFGDRARLLVMTTNAASTLIPDHSLDFVFIDADHGYDAVTQDIAHWRSKVTHGGWLGGHDYNRKFPGVVSAVDRVFGRKVRLWPGSIWGVWQ